MKGFLGMKYIVSVCQQMIDLREETPDQTAVRLFQLLRVLKYKPPDSVSL